MQAEILVVVRLRERRNRNDSVSIRQTLDLSMPGRMISQRVLTYWLRLSKGADAFWQSENIDPPEKTVPSRRSAYCTNKEEDKLGSKTPSMPFSDSTSHRSLKPVRRKSKIRAPSRIIWARLWACTTYEPRDPWKQLA